MFQRKRCDKIPASLPREKGLTETSTVLTDLFQHRWLIQENIKLFSKVLNVRDYDCSLVTCKEGGVVMAGSNEAGHADI